MKKYLLNMILSLGAVLLVGCGGGGGGSSSTASLAYEGKTEKAALTEENTKYFLDLLGNFSQSIDIPSYLKTQKIAVAYKSNYNLGKTSAITYKVIDSGSIDGAISGSLTVVVEETGTFTGLITYTYDNYSDYEGIIYNGTIVNYLTVNELEIITKSVMDYQLFNVKIISDDVTIDGTMTASEVQSGTEIIENFVAKNNKTNEMLKYEDYETLLNTQGQVVSFNGKVYNSNYGYVDVSTLVPLAYNNDGSRKAEGELLIDAEGSSTTIKYAYDNRIRVEIDSDKDGTVDAIQVYREGDYTKELPNEAPVINITFPQSIYTDTDMSTVQVNVYDPDLDGFTTVYEWTVNGTVQGSQVALDNKLFKKHDRLKLTVSATDDRVGDVKSSTKVKEQVVLNSAPVIILDLNATEIEVGQSISLDASKSYDVDGDSFTHTWSTQNRIYNIHDEPYNQGQLYLDIDENNMSKILFLGQKVNYDSYQEVGAYGVHLELDDGDTNGISDRNSTDIVVNVMDLFNKELVVLKDKNVLADAITAITMGDINKDGLKDIVVVTDTYGDYVDNGKLIIFLQTNEHGFEITKKITLDDIAPYSYNSISIGDLNNDGLEDIAYTAPTIRGFSVYYQSIDGDFIEEKMYFTKTFSYVPFPSEPDMVDYISNSVDYLTAADINDDGKHDVVTIGSNPMTSGSTGMDIFLQNDNNLSDSKILVLDNRTIENDGYYETTDSHKISDIYIRDIDKDGQKDFVVANYVQYRENNGTFSEKLYEEVDSITSANLDENISVVLGVNTFDKKLFIYNQMNSSNRNYQESGTLDILVANPNQVYGAYIRDTFKSDVIVGHSSWGYFTLFAQKENGFYGDQLYKLNDKLTYASPEKSIIIDDIDNNNKDDVLLLGRRGFEIYYTK